MASQYSGGKEYYIGDEYSAKIGNRVIKMFAYFPKDTKLGDTINTRIYWPGKGGYESNPGQYVPISDYYADNNNVDYAMLSFGDCTEYNSITQEVIDQVVSQIKTEKGIDLTINSVTGLSAGGDDLVANTLNILRTDPSAEEQRMLLYDPYGGVTDGFKYNLSDDDLRLMRNNGTEAVFFLPINRGYTYRNALTNEGKFVNTLAANGIPVVLIDGNFVHGDSTANAMYNGWMDFLDGYCELEDISLINCDYRKGNKTIDLNYQISVPSTDSQGNITWLTYKLADLIDAKLHPNNYSSQQLSEFNHVTDCLYDVVQVMDPDSFKNRAQRLLSSFSALLDSSVSNCESTGSSILIPGEVAAIAEIKNTLIAVRDSFEKEINYLLYAEEEYINMDNQLAANTKELRSIVNDSLTNLKIPMVSLELEFEESKEKEQNAAGTNYNSSSGYIGGMSNNSHSAVNNNSLSENNSTTIQDNLEHSVNSIDNDENLVTNETEKASNNESNDFNSLSNQAMSQNEHLGNNTVITNLEYRNTYNNDNFVDDLNNDAYLDDNVEVITDAEDSYLDNSTSLNPVNDLSSSNAYSESVTKNKGNNILKTVGVLTAAGAATAAGAYATKKYLDKKKNDETYDDEYKEFSYDDRSNDNDEI